MIKVSVENFQSIEKTLKLADIFYDSSFKSINEIPLNCRFAILVARRVYRQIGNKILAEVIASNIAENLDTLESL